MLRAYCTARQISPFELYVDGGYSGSSVGRPALQRMIADARAGKLSCVVVYKLDRLSRSQKDTLWLIEDVLNPAGVDFVSLNENMDTATPIGRAMLGIMSAFAQLERETIRERTRMGMRERVKSGLWPGGGKVPFGYDYDEKQGILVPNADAETVRRIYELYLRGWSMMRIARVTGLKYERLAQQILLRRTNTGLLCYGGEVYQGKHQPLVSQETFDRAMELFQARSRGSMSGSAEHLLAGLLVCGVCGAKMRYQKWGKRGDKIYCYSQDKGKPHLSHGGPCNNSKVWADEIEETVREDLFRLADVFVQDEAGGEDLALEQTLSGRLEQAEKRLKKLYMLYADSPDDLLLDSIHEAKREREQAQQELENYRADQNQAAGEAERREAVAQALHTLRDAWPFMTQGERRSLLRQVIERIVITHDRVDIFYRYQVRP